MRSWLLALTPLLPTLALGCAPAAPPAAPAGVGVVTALHTESKLPVVPILDLDRAPKSVEGVRAGRAALVSFWATWCDACQREMPALNRLDERATGDKAVVIGVAVGEPSSKVRGFVEKHGLRYAQLVDEEFQLTDALGQKRLPTTLVVNRQGEVVFTGGALDADALAAFRKAMSE